MIKLEEKKIRELLRIGKKVAKLLESGCYIEYFEGVEKDVLFDTPYKIKIGAEPLKEVAKYILSLLEAREKEAVEGFAKWLGNKQDKRSGFVGDGICPCCTTEMLEEAEQYLTQTKGDKE